MDENVDRQGGLAAVGIFRGLLALLGVVFSVGLSVRAVDDAKDSRGVSASSGAEVEVSLSEFKIDPMMPSIPSGGSLKVTNKGSAPHNLTIEGTDQQLSLTMQGVISAQGQEVPLWLSFVVNRVGTLVSRVATTEIGLEQGLGEALPGLAMTQAQRVIDLG